jgi:enoyl-CoA hydratase/carnithine racemase
VDLNRAGHAVEIERPPFVLIGVGPADHPLARHMDVRIEPPVTLDAVIRSILAHPNAASVLIHLLRLIEGQGMDAALTQESLAYSLLQGGKEHGAWLAARTPPVALPPGGLSVSRIGNRIDIRLDRSHALNAIDRVMRDALFEAFTVASLDPDVTAVTVRGSGRAFCVGADLAEFGTTRDPALAHRIRMQTLPARAIIGCRSRLAVHVHGACVGAGLEMAAFAARLTATRTAWFHLPELGMGLLPGAGGCVSLSHRMGRQRAALLILSGRRIDARTALSWGLVDAIVDADPGDERGTDVVG